MKKNIVIPNSDKLELKKVIIDEYPCFIHYKSNSLKAWFVSLNFARAFVALGSEKLVSQAAALELIGKILEIGSDAGNYRVNNQGKSYFVQLQHLDIESNVTSGNFTSKEEAEMHVKKIIKALMKIKNYQNK